MPDKSSIPLSGYKCPSCASAPVDCLPAFREGFPSSPRESCCLFKATQQGHPAFILKKVSQERSISDFPWKDLAASVRTCQQPLVQGPTHQLLPVDSFAPENGGVANIPSPPVPRRQRRKCAKIRPRNRPGFTKLTIEVRPPGFKKKLWFGTYEKSEIERAIDAINFYMENEEPPNFPDSPQLFSRYPLEIRYKDLLPSCEEYVFVGKKSVRKSAQFAKLVKATINHVTGKQKAKRNKKVKKPKLDLSAPSLLSASSSGAVSVVTSICDSASSSINKPRAFDSISSSIGPTAGFSSFSIEKLLEDMIHETASLQDFAAVNSNTASLYSLPDPLPPLDEVWDSLEPLSSNSTDGVPNGIMGDDVCFHCWK